MSIIRGIMVPHPPIIIPEIGRGEEQKINETLRSYTELGREIAELAPETIVITSPHSILYADYFHISPGKSAAGSFESFSAPQVRVSVDYDTEFVDEIVTLADQHGFPAGTMGEREASLDHGTMIPLYFINKGYARLGKEPDYQVIRIGISGLSLLEHYALGALIAQASEVLGRRTVFTASGDLSHYLKEDGPYGFRREGPEYDRRIMEIMGSGDFAGLFDFDEGFLDAAGECGHRSFVIMAGAFDGINVEPRKMSYQGTFGVGYGICDFRPTAEDGARNFGQRQLEREQKRLQEKKAAEDPYVRLARLSLETYIATGRRAEMPEDLPEDLLNRRAGAFVSLHEGGSLRGCIGTIGPTRETLAEEIMENAVSAAVNDPRFPAITVEELDQLEYSVDVLGRPERILSERELDPSKYGVIVTNNGRRGLLLPNLDGVNTVERQISIAKQKAGIGKEEAVELERFEVVRHD